MRATTRLLRSLPNALSTLRILAAPAMLLLAMRGDTGAFTALLVPALLSDAADGYLARRLGCTSALGALLDSAGDLVLFCAAAGGVVMLHPELVLAHRLESAALVALWLSEPLVALARYGRISSFHTYASKGAAYLLGFMVAVLFVFGLPPLLFHVAVGAGILASLEELMLIAVLPAWRANVRGLYWVLRETRASTS
jgi:CDP-diacylglycerol--glycerol-3-phosphate 3-phosphatidyltransferase